MKEELLKRPNDKLIKTAGYHLLFYLSIYHTFSSHSCLFQVVNAFTFSIAASFLFRLHMHACGLHPHSILQVRNEILSPQCVVIESSPNSHLRATPLYGRIHPIQKNRFEQYTDVSMQKSMPPRPLPTSFAINSTLKWMLVFLTVPPSPSPAGSNKCEFKSSTLG